jgi:hypothetical protein
MAREVPNRFPAEVSNLEQTRAAEYALIVARDSNVETGCSAGHSQN